MSARENLVEATKQLLWERGYAATSPRDILQASGAGQGSMYHHFSGKSDLAATALGEVATEMQASAQAILHANKPPLERVVDYLKFPREALLGCRLGRLAAEQEIVTDPIRNPVLTYFSYLESALEGCLEEAQRTGDLRDDVNAHDMAVHLTAVIQGGYVLSRVFQDAAQMESAVRAAIVLLSGTFS